MVKFVGRVNGLKCFSRGDCFRMIKLIEFSLTDDVFAFHNAEWCLKFKGKLLAYVNRTWGDAVVVPEYIDRQTF